ncbi:hypothetical protein FO507_15140 [Bacillus mojavensis]|nr:hypothetical protein [Bacillus mojavensis]
MRIVSYLAASCSGFDSSLVYGQGQANMTLLLDRNFICHLRILFCYFAHNDDNTLKIKNQYARMTY